jgi:hypothetical protein
VLAAMLFSLFVSFMPLLYVLDLMYESGYCYVNCHHSLFYYCDRTVYAFSSYPLRLAIVHTPRVHS